MDVRLAVVLCMTCVLSCSLCQGQNTLLLYGDYILTFANFKADFQNASDNCYINHNGALVRTPHKTLREHILKQNQDLTKEDLIWIDDNVQNEDYSSDYTTHYDDYKDLTCTAISLNNGTITQKNCSQNLPYVCQIQAWMVETSYFGSNYTFSNAKLRYKDAKKMCQAKNKHATTATIESKREQRFVTEVARNISEREGGNEYNYFINTNTGVYKNWMNGGPKTLIKDDICVRMSGEDKTFGKWSNVSCYSYNHFICKWSIQDEPTTGTEENVSDSTTKATAGPKKQASMAPKGKTERKGTTELVSTPVDMDNIYIVTESGHVQGAGTGSTISSSTVLTLPSVFTMFMSVFLMLMSI